MNYVRNGKRGHLDALRIQQQITAAEVEKAEAELAAIREIEIDLARLQRRKEYVAAELKRSRERTKTVRVQLALPTPTHGGQAGLLAAVEESKAYDKRKRAVAA